jgi:hypothetical protein
MPLPDKNSPSLRLTHPTPEEKTATWKLSCKNWGSALGTTSYLEREEYLTTVPLAENNGVTHWILVDASLLPNDRPILASCESLRKHALISQNGSVREVITHGIGSVFCNPDYRGKGYAGRMLKELGPILNTWQVTEDISGSTECPFSFLYSDIGKKYYAGLGWHAFPSTHIAFAPTKSSAPETAKRLNYPDIEALCKLDEKYTRQNLEQANDEKIHVALIPDFAQMQWHHLREDFMTKKLFNDSPATKGAIVGATGSRVWALWTRSFYGPVDATASGNALHILRLVIEDESKTKDNAQALKSILEIAQTEAAEWKLLHVELWNPTEYVRNLVEKTGLKHESVERQQESIASLMWYGEGSGKVDQLAWVGNEKYGWC